MVALSIEITVHNYGPGSRATHGPRCFQTALQPTQAGIDGAGTGAQECQGVLRTVMSPRSPLVAAPHDCRVMESRSRAR
jgi:hypothetical protein